MAQGQEFDTELRSVGSFLFLYYFINHINFQETSFIACTQNSTRAIYRMVQKVVYMKQLRFGRTIRNICIDWWTEILSVVMGVCMTIVMCLWIIKFPLDFILKVETYVDVVLDYSEYYDFELGNTLDDYDIDALISFAQNALLFEDASIFLTEDGVIIIY